MVARSDTRRTYQTLSAPVPAEVDGLVFGFTQVRTPDAGHEQHRRDLGTYAHIVR